MGNMSNLLFSIAELKQGRGGRISSPQYRRAQEMSEEFAGLESDVNRYDLLLLVKRIGKQAGFTPRMISLLDYYMAFTKDCDWTRGSSPIVYQSLSKTALDLGISERQVQRLEQSLFEAGALSWNDSGNHRRYGKRDDAGRIMYAYGVDLTPLAYLKDALQGKLQEKQMSDAAWMDTKRQISYYRGQIRAVMCEMELLTLDGQGDYTAIIADIQGRYEPISLQIRTHLSLEDVRGLLASHKELHAIALAAVDVSAVDKSLEKAMHESQETKQMSPKNDSDDVHYNSTIKKQSDKSDTSRDKPRSFQESGNEPLMLHTKPSQPANHPAKAEEKFSESEELVLSTGLQHITLKQALNASSERFRSHMPMANRPMNWHDFVEAAFKLKGELSISQNSWANACATLSRNGAAICLLLTDQAQQREHKPVYKTGAYFNAMINRAKEGELHLHNSIFGILKKEFGEQEVALHGGIPFDIKVPNADTLEAMAELDSGKTKRFKNRNDLYEDLGI